MTFTLVVLKVSALARLGMNLMTESPRDADWRLCPTPRALGILAHHLISLQQDHSEKMPGKAEPSCRLAWERLISTLKKSICDHPVDEKLFEGAARKSDSKRKKIGRSLLF